MKKFLSLVLALVMTMSLVTISAGAKDFTDDSAINYEEAVKVMDLLGVINGYEDGSFKPTNTLTRGAAAKIICNLLLTPDVAKDLAGSSTKFKDVPATNNFSGYIAYCSNQGIINGYKDGTFRPAGTLNGYAFMKMLLGALGYDAEIEGYVNAGWEVNVAAKVSELKLAAGTTFVGTKAVTREEACLYAFNLLGKNMVKYQSKGTSIPVNGGNLVIGATPATPTGLTFAETKFAGLSKVKNATDAFGRPVTTWKYGKASATVATGTVLTYKGVVTGKALYADLGLAKNESATVNELTVNKNSTNENVLKGTTANTATYIYAAGEGKYDAIIVTYVPTTVAKVNKANAKTETARSIQLADAAVASQKFETENFAVGENVFYALGTDKTIAEVIAVESVKGTATAKRGSTVTVAGTVYGNGASVAVNDEGTFYLTYDGSTIFKKVATGGVESDLYGYVYNTQVVKGGVDDDGFNTGDKTVVYFVKADGTKASATLAAKSTVANGKVYNYALNDKGEFVVIGTAVDSASLKLDKTQVLVMDKETSYLATGTTKYVFVNREASKVTVNVVTGYTNAKTAEAQDVVVVADANNRATTVFVTGNAAGVETTGLNAFMVDNDYTETSENGNAVYTFGVYGVEGGVLKTTSTTVRDQLAAIANGARFTYKVTDGYVTEVKAVAANITGTVTDNVDNEYFLVGSRVVTFAKDVTVYVYDTSAETVFTTATVASVAADANVQVWTNDNGEASIIVVTAE